MLDHETTPNLNILPSYHWLHSIDNKRLFNFCINNNLIPKNSISEEINRTDLQTKVYSHLSITDPQNKGKDFPYQQFCGTPQENITLQHSPQNSDNQNLIDSGINSVLDISDFETNETTLFDLQILDSLKANFALLNSDLQNNLLYTFRQNLVDPNPVIRYIESKTSQLPKLSEIDREYFLTILEKKKLKLNQPPQSTNPSTSHTTPTFPTSPPTIDTQPIKETEIMAMSFTKPSTYSHAITEDITNFIIKFENECDAYNWADDETKLKKIKIAFTDVAENRFNDIIKPLNLNTWEEMKEKLIETFCRTRPILQNQLNKIQYQGDDLFYEYINKIAKLMKKINDNENDDNIVQRIVEGFPEKQKEFFSLHNAKTMADLQKLFPDWLTYQQRIYPTNLTQQKAEIEKLKEKLKLLEEKNSSNKINDVKEISSGSSDIDSMIEKLKSHNLMVVPYNAINSIQHNKDASNSNFQQNPNFQSNNTRGNNRNFGNRNNANSNPRIQQPNTYPNQNLNPNPNYKGRNYNPNYIADRRNQNFQNNSYQNSQPAQHFPNNQVATYQNNNQNFNNRRNFNNNNNNFGNNSFGNNNYRNFGYNNYRNNRNFNNYQRNGPSWQDIESFMLGKLIPEPTTNNTESVTKVECVDSCLSCGPCRRKNHLESRELFIGSCDKSTSCKILLPVTVQAFSTQALVDSGAECSVVKSTLCAGLKFNPTGNTLRDANGNFLEVSGTVKLSVKFSAPGHDQPLTFQFIAYAVVGLTSDLILGFDFLEKFDALINFATHTLRLTENGQTIQVTFPQCNTQCKSALPFDDSPLINKVSFNKSNNISTPLTISEPLNSCLRIPPKISPSIKYKTTSIDDFHSNITLRDDFVIKPNEIICLLENISNKIFYPSRKLELKLNLKIFEKENEIYIHNININPRRLRKNQILGRLVDKNYPSEKELPLCNNDFKQGNNRINTNDINKVELTQDKKLSMLDDDNAEIKFNPNLSTEQHNLAVSKFLPLRSIFVNDSKRIRKANVDPQHVNTYDRIPIKRRNYQQSYREHEATLEIVNKMVNCGQMKQKKTPYESPIFIKMKPCDKNLDKNDPNRKIDYRFLVDFRAVNKKIIKDNNRVPNIDTIWPYLRNKKYFSCIDLSSGYYQIPLDDESQDITGINIDGISYVFTVIPMGLCVSPSIYQTLMTDLFSDMLWKKVIVYLDDICAFGETFEECLENTLEVISRLKSKNLQIKTTKSDFFMTEVELLGHRISHNCIKPQNKHLDAIKNLKPPTTYKQLRRLIGILNYHRKRIQNFSKEILPITDLLKGIDSKLNGKLKNWENRHDESFQKIKDILLTEPILNIFNPDATTYLEVDASAYAIGAVLKQIDPISNEKNTIGYFSKKLGDDKRHLCSFDLEMLAITETCQFFRYYLLGKKFTIFTDHQPLTFQHRFTIPSPRLARLISKLSEFNFEIKHISGKENIIADFLSRYPTDACIFENGKFNEPTTPLLNDSDIKAITRSKTNSIPIPTYKETRKYTKKTGKNENISANKQNTTNSQSKLDDKDDDEEVFFDALDVIESPLVEKNEKNEKNDSIKTSNVKDKINEVDLSDSIFENLSQKQKTDKFWKLMITYLKYKNLNLSKRLKKQLKYNSNLFALNDHGVLFKKKRIDSDISTAVPVIPNDLIPIILKLFHDSPHEGGHLGFTKTYNKIKEKFYFRDIKNTIKKYIKTCHKCQLQQKSPPTIGKMQPILPKKFVPFDHVELDFIGKLDVPFTKNYICVSVDKNSNYCIVQLTSTPNAQTVVRLLKRICRDYNIPKKISTDNGSHFSNELVANFCKNKGISHVFSSTYSPQSQGLVERMNGILKNALKKYTPKNNEEWEDLVNDVVSNYNNSPITHFNNKSPFYLIHGYNKKSLLENKLKIVEPPSAEPRLDEISDVEKIRDEIPKLIEKNAMRNKQYYDKNKLPSIFHPNSLVLVRQAKNLAQTKSKFDGPYRVVEKLGDLTYLIKIEDKIEQIHVRRLIEYNQRNKDENKKIPPPLNIDEELGKIGRSTDNLISSIANDIPIDSNPKLYSEPPKSPTRKCLIDKPVLLSRIDSGFEPCIINFNNEDFNDFTFPITDLKMGELPSLRYWKLKFLVLLECYEERNRINQVSSEPESDETDYDENYSEVTYHHNEVVTLPSASGSFPDQNPSTQPSQR
ncbi:hypothetical protein V9T40_005372 [Parthenolecanium corni]|uniref:RNA-directed DNA polymerase n=1 Tax=Parthenolecanium corni TaxID=536013 RepID=A0AAN9Y4P4_9HEMI